MSWLEKKLKQWGVLELSPEEQKEEELDYQEKAGNEEMEAVREEANATETAEDDLKLVIDGAKIQCTLCAKPEGTLTVNQNTPTTQNKATATIAEKDCMSLVFDGNCTKSPFSASPCKSVMQLAEWENIGNGQVQGNAPLLLKSTVNCIYGGVPITITDCGQTHSPEEIDTEGAPVLVSDNNDDNDEGEKVNYVVEFSRLENYQGEFGFDWMRKEYLPEAEGGKGICIDGIEELKKVYEPFKLDIKDKKGKAYGNYYTPWVSMFPNHKQKIGKEVQLNMKINSHFKVEENIPYEEKLTFNSSNSAVEVGALEYVYNENTGKSDTILVPSITYNHFYEKSFDNEEIIIQINCTEELTEDVTIDVLSSDGLTVGRLNVMKNVGYEKNILNLRMVYVKKAEVKNNKQNIEDEITKIGGYQVLEDYLNKKVFCQSLIQCKIITEDPDVGTLQMDFSNYSLKELGKVYNKDGKLTDGALSYFRERFKLKRDTAKASEKNGIFIFLTSMDSVDANGAGIAYPREANGLIMYADGISNNISTYAHELGHVLGLLHSFLDKGKNSCCMISTEDKIKETNDKLTKLDKQLKEAKIDLQKNKDSFDENIAYKKKYGGTDEVLVNIEKTKEYKKVLNNRIKNLEDSIKASNDKIELLLEEKIHFKQGKTENLMDYSWGFLKEPGCEHPNKKFKNLNKRRTFNKPQWDLMLEDIKYYL